MADAHGRFVWYDLQTTDMDGAIRFYTQVVGWSTEPFDAGKPYTMWKPAVGSPIGGVAPIPKEVLEMGVPPNWTAHIAVPDIQAALKAIVAHGGKQMMPEIIEIPGIGKMTVVTDPFGAAFWVFQPAGDMNIPDGPPTPGQVSWTELTTDNTDAALSFYNAVFGWQKSGGMDMGPEFGFYQIFGPDEQTMMGGIMKRPPGMPVNAWLYYFYVADVAGAIDKAVALGGQLLNGPQEIPGGDLVAQLLDPQGAAFALHGPKPKG